MATVSTSFTAVGSGGVLSVKRGDNFTYALSGTFDATVVLEKSETGGAAWETVVSATAADSGTIYVESKSSDQVLYRYRCSDFTSGTAVTSITDGAKDKFVLENQEGTDVFKVTEAGVSIGGTQSFTGAVSMSSTLAVTGNTVFSSNVGVGASAASPISGTTGPALGVIGSGVTNSDFAAIEVGSSPTVTGRYSSMLNFSNHGASSGKQAAYIGVVNDGTITTQAQSAILFATNNGTAVGERMRLDKDGKLGIGMTPTKTLDVTGTLGVTGASSLGGNVAISNSAPSLALTDTTASAKSLTIAVDANAANIRESAGAASSLMVLDLANNRVGIAVAPTLPLDVAGRTQIKADGSAGSPTVLIQPTTGTNPVNYGINTSGTGGYFGAEASAGGTCATGSSNYALLFGSSNSVPLEFITNNTVRGSFGASGGLNVIGAITAPVMNTAHVFDGATGTVNAATSSGRGWIIFNASTTITLNGIAAGVDGQRLVISNKTGNTITVNDSSASAAAGDKIVTSGGGGTTIPNFASKEFIYDSYDAYWWCY